MRTMTCPLRKLATPDLASSVSCQLPSEKVEPMSSIRPLNRSPISLQQRLCWRSTSDPPSASSNIMVNWSSKNALPALSYTFVMQATDLSELPGLRQTVRSTCQSPLPFRSYTVCHVRSSSMTYCSPKAATKSSAWQWMRHVRLLSRADGIAVADGVGVGIAPGGVGVGVAPGGAGVGVAPPVGWAHAGSPRSALYSRVSVRLYGTHPVKSLSCSHSLSSDRLFSVSGICPLRLLSETKSQRRLLRFPISGGMLPDSSLM